MDLLTHGPYCGCPLGDAPTAYLLVVYRRRPLPRGLGVALHKELLKRAYKGERPHHQAPHREWPMVGPGACPRKWAAAHQADVPGPLRMRARPACRGLMRMLAVAG